MVEPAELVRLMRRAFDAVDELCSSLVMAEWDLPTDLPGWSVKDNLSHLCGIETMLLGRRRPEPVADWPPHVKSQFGANNEADLELRRSWPPDRILAEFRDLTKERLRVLEQLDHAAWEGETMTPVGSGDMKDMISIRILDVFYHEQDIRRATGRPGNIGGDVGRFVARRMQRTIPATVGKRTAPPDGSVVSFVFADDPARSITLSMRGGRAERAEGEDATVTLRMSIEAFLCFCGGRWNVDEAIGSGRVEIEGDPALGRRVLEKMAVTP